MKKIVLKDSGVIYEPEGHTYTLNGKRLKGITGTLINRAYPKDETYANVAPEVLEHAARRGSACHQAVDNLFELGLASTGYEETSAEVVKLLKSKGLTPIRFEYVVSDLQHYASPIDIVCMDEKGSIAIVDMKFTSKLLLEQVTLQTSIYKRFFHIVNPDYEAESLYALHVHTNDSNEVLDSGIYDLTPMSNEFIDDLIKADQEDTAFDAMKYYGDLPTLVKAKEPRIVQLQRIINESTEEMNSIKEELTRAMMESSLNKISTEYVQMTKVTPKPRVTFDSKSFKTDYPELYKSYSTVNETKPSVRFTIKNELDGLCR